MHTKREEWLKARLNCITGSDASVICGVNPYRNRVDLWLEKTGQKVQEDISERPHVKAGIMLEDSIAKWFELETGLKTLQCPEMIYHPTIHFMAGNIDRRIEGHPNEILEIKTSNDPRKWGDPFTDEIPEQYLMQVAHYCLVTGAEICYIAVLFHGVDFKIYKYVRSPKLESVLLEKEKWFWEECIVGGKPPEPITAKEMLALRGVVSSGSTKIATNEITELMNHYNMLDLSIRADKEKLDDIKDKICLFMGDNEMLLDGFGNPLATWKNYAGARHFKKELLAKDYPKLIEKYTVTGNAYRRFLPKKGM